MSPGKPALFTFRDVEVPLIPTKPRTLRGLKSTGHRAHPQGTYSIGQLPPERGLREWILTEELIQNLSKILQAGSHMEVAGAALGIPVQTLYRWFRSGVSGKGSPLEERLVEKVAQALALAEVNLLAKLHADDAHVDGKWKPKAWLLERRWPNRWGRRTQTEISGPGGGPVQAQIEALPAPVRAALVSKLTGGVGPSDDDLSYIGTSPGGPMGGVVVEMPTE